MKGDRERCLEAGMDDYVAKPVQPDELFTAVEAVATGTGDADRAARPVMAAPAAASIDELRGRFAGDEALLREIVELFLAATPALLDGLRGSIERGDAAAVARDAHALRGSVSHFGAAAAVDAANELEAMARSEDLTRAPGALRALEAALADLEPVLAALRDGA
jgi:protein-histidine pros-kinase